MKNKHLIVIPRENETHRQQLITHGINLEDVVICNANDANELQSSLKNLHPLQKIFILRETPFDEKTTRMYSWILRDVILIKKKENLRCEIYTYIETLSEGTQQYLTIPQLKATLYQKQIRAERA